MPSTLVCGDARFSEQRHKSLHFRSGSKTSKSHEDPLYPARPEEWAGPPRPARDDSIYRSQSAPGSSTSIIAQDGKYNFASAMSEWCAAPVPSIYDGVSELGKTSEYDSAWLTYSNRQNEPCKECCESVPIRSDTPIAELAREWIRFRNAEDTGTWTPPEEEGVFAESPAMLRFVHFMRNQYACAEGCPGAGSAALPKTGCSCACPAQIRGRSLSQAQSIRASTSPRDLSPAERARKTSLGTHCVRRRSSSPAVQFAAPFACSVKCDPAHPLTPVQEERLGEIAQELRRAVEMQSGRSSQSCPPCKWRDRGSQTGRAGSLYPLLAQERRTNQIAPPPLSARSTQTNAYTGGTRRSKQTSRDVTSASYSYCPSAINYCDNYDSHMFRVGDEEDPPLGYYDSASPPPAPSQFWVDEERPSATYGDVAPQGSVLNRLRSVTQVHCCGKKGCPATLECCRNAVAECLSPLAVFNFNECATTFQQHLHGPEDADDCADVLPLA